MKLSAILAPLIAAGVPGEVILATVKAFEDERADLLEKRRESDRIRQTAKRSRESRDTSTVSRDRPLTRADDAPATEENKQTNKPEKKENKSPRDELASVLDAEHADAVLDHRNRLRKPLSQRAAHLLAASLASCPDANAAADMMIESGWLKIKPDWLESRSRQNGHGPPRGKRMNAVEAYLSLHTERENEQGSRTIDNRDVELLPPDKSGLPSPVADLVQAFRWPVGQRDN